MWREQALKILLLLVGLLFTAAIYPLIGGLSDPTRSDTGDTMMMSLYVILGIFLLIAARNPSAPTPRAYASRRTTSSSTGSPWR